MMKKYLLLFTLLFALTCYGCTAGQTASPTQVVEPPTATALPVEPTATIEPEENPTATPTMENESESPTEPAPPTPEPTAEPTLEPTPTSIPEEVAEPTPRPECAERVAFYGDVTIPDDTVVRQGEVFLKIWKVRNEGTCTWDSDYNLVFAGGSQMSGAASSPLPGAAPGEIVEIPIELTAPSRGGTYVGNWMFSDPEGNWFGVGATGRGELWVRVITNYISSGGTDPGDPAPGTTEPAACGSQRNTAYENEVLNLINNARVSNGLPALIIHDKLTEAALRHSNDMACNDFVDHSGSDGTLWYDRISEVGYIYTTAKENIYVGDPAFGGTPAGAFTWWMNSQIHRDNILSQDVTEIGVGYVYNSSSSYGGYYTLVFARR